MAKKIGTITFHRADNYGAVLQAYALQQALLAMGADTEIIDYDAPYISSGYKAIRTDSMKRFIKSLLTYGDVSAKRKAFYQFRSRFFKLSPPVTKKNLSELAKKYDAVVTGSDQVWNGTLTNKDGAYFLDFVGPEKRYSYAASFGISKIPAEDVDFYKEKLKNYHHYSTREETGARLLKELVGKEAVVDLDPVFLPTVDQWKKMIHPVNRKPYIFIYLPAPHCIPLAQKLAKERNLGIVYIAYDKSVLHPGKNLKDTIIDASPDDFLSLIYHASCVVTGSFHATVFSAIFHKEFYAEAPARVGSRITDVLHTLCLEDRLIINDELKVRKPIDWKAVDERVTERRELSLKHLSESLGLKYEQD